MKFGNNIITIDGPAGSGKGTVARLIAKEIKYSYLDTGAMYRTIALAFKENGVDINNVDQLESLLNEIDLSIEFEDEEGITTYLNGEDVTSRIRTPEISILSSDIAKIKTVRSFLVNLQRKICSGQKIVVEGRDMGTVVFPEAKYKFYLDALPEERARRRLLQLNNNLTYEMVLDEIKKRDKQDMEREESPLHPAPNAVIIDTTELTPSEVVVKILKAMEAAQTIL